MTSTTMHTDCATVARVDAALILLALATPAFLWAVAGFRAAVSRGTGRGLGTIDSAAALFLGLTILSAAVGGAVPNAVEFFDAYRVDPGAHLALTALGHYLDVFASVAGAVLIAVATARAADAGLLGGRWRRAGQAWAVLTFLAAWIGMGLLPIAVWLLVVPAIALRARRPGSGRVASRAGYLSPA